MCTYLSCDKGGGLGEYFSHVLINLGTIGVGIFYLISGLNFHPKKYSLTDSIKLKFINIIVPWLFVGTMVWLYVVLRKGGISFDAWFKFIMGYKSYLYFLTNLIFFFFLFGIISLIGTKTVRNIIYIFFIPFSCAMIILEYKGKHFFPTSYLDPFIFIGYFSAGQLIQENELYFKINKFFYPFCLVFFIIPFVPYIYLSYSGNPFVLLFETLFILGAFALGKICKQFKCKNMLIWIGKNSLAIYLIHMPFAGMVSNVFNRFSWAVYFDLFRPVLTFFVTLFFIYMIIEICKMSRNNWCLKVFGIKTV